MEPTKQIHLNQNLNSQTPNYTIPSFSNSIPFPKSEISPSSPQTFSGAIELPQLKLSDFHRLSRGHPYYPYNFPPTNILPNHSVPDKNMTNNHLPPIMMTTNYYLRNIILASLIQQVSLSRKLQNRVNYLEGEIEKIYKELKQNNRRDSRYYSRKAVEKKRRLKKEVNNIDDNENNSIKNIAKS
ncbi:hypothetical protein G9A89_018263 [Geosiphon pyriformis]|nr:hypothetical protein G9A89_018263 [Geosiphon pyriformis]